MPRDGRIVRERLQRSALELFTEHGYDGATAGQIAAHAGVTERTFFRHFPDKREVLFASEEELREVLSGALAAVPPELEALPTLRRAFHDVVPLLERNRPLAELRAPVIRAAPALRERESAKATALVTLVAEALEKRGVSARSALLCARVGMDAFSTAIRRWMTEPSPDLHAEVDEAFEELRALTGAL
ncbi:TetR/AcrR family transcriptional regulator [Kineosporia sp. NBRC 101731]|uniref:TetR/AcrR family transcriptional regulator n=1 Tax=Kineosporia sp. NBRC 101731 TaxID=3032199 RepID=UPI0024A184F4|nr:TetR/AcrR family transcriptional regulator [Kineosporia sp. NBRC 101731]GLY29531.1 TetR family transcriptional regulator [Kineosporia sp. NBRC 101731]